MDRDLTQDEMSDAELMELADTVLTALHARNKLRVYQPSEHRAANCFSERKVTAIEADPIIGHVVIKIDR